MKRRAKRFGHYGWKVLAVATLCHYFGWASTIIHSFGLFVIPISEDMGWSRGEIMYAQSISRIAVLLVAPIVGVLIDRFGAKRILATSTTLMGLLLLVLATEHEELPVFYLLFGLMGLVGAGTTGLVYAKLILTWFEKRKGVALGIVLSGAALAATFNPPLLSWMIAEHGWRATYGFLGVVNLVLILPLILFVVRSDPADMGLRREGEEEVEAAAGRPAAVARVERGYPFRQAVRMRTYWIAAALFTVLGFGQASFFQLVPLLMDDGYTAATASIAASVFGATMLCSRLATGALVDHFHLKRIASICIVGALGGLFILLFLSAHWPLVLLAACLLGLIYGAETDLMSYFIIAYFGRPALGRLQAIIFTLFTCGTSGGTLFVGAMYDKFGSYDAALIIDITSLIIVLGLLRLLGPYPELPTVADAPASPRPAQEQAA